MLKIDKKFFKLYYPRRTKNSFKNLNGKVFIVAGSKDMPGAAVLAARAAYAAGAGFTTVACAEQARGVLVNALPEALVLDIKSSDGFLGEYSLSQIELYLKSNPQDVLLTGCGLGRGAEITERLLRFANLPAVVDADSLNFMAKIGAGKLKGPPCVLTPHEGEIKRLLGQIPFERETAALKISALTGAVCLLKGPNTQVCFGGEKRINTSGNEGLAKAGSGDVLSGIIAAVWGKLLKSGNGLSSAENGFLAASLGVFLHGFCADYAARTISKESITPSLLIQVLPYALKELLD